MRGWEIFLPESCTLQGRACTPAVCSNKSIKPTGMLNIFGRHDRYEAVLEFDQAGSQPSVHYKASRRNTPSRVAHLNLRESVSDWHVRRRLNFGLPPPPVHLITFYSRPFFFYVLIWAIYLVSYCKHTHCSDSQETPMPLPHIGQHQG